MFHHPTNFGIDGELEREQFDDDDDIGWGDVATHLVVVAAGAVSLVDTQWSNVFTFCQVVGRVNAVRSRLVTL